jgi:hypothetical protein
MVMARAIKRAEVSFTKKTAAAPISGRKISAVSQGNECIIGQSSLVNGYPTRINPDGRKRGNIPFVNDH